MSLSFLGEEGKGFDKDTQVLCGDPLSSLALLPQLCTQAARLEERACASLETRIEAAVERRTAVLEAKVLLSLNSLTGCWAHSEGRVTP